MKFFVLLPAVLALALLTLPITGRADSDSPPDGKKGWLQKLSSAGDAPRSAETTPTIGVRGLDEPSQSGDTTVRDYAAIKRLEKLQITPADLEQFKVEGNLP